MQAYDLVVIGAGLAGSGLAAYVAAQGYRVLLVERRRLPAHKVCGEFLSPEAQASLQTLGVHAPLARLAPAAMDAATLTTATGTTLHTSLPGTAWGLSRYAMDAALVDAATAAGATVVQGTTALSYAPVGAAGDGWCVTLRDAAGTHDIPTRAVVVASGRHTSPGLRAAQHTRPNAETAVGVKCHMRGIDLPPQVELYLFPGGYTGLGLVEDGAVNVCLLVSRAAFRHAGNTPHAMLHAMQAWNPALRRRLAGGSIVPETVQAVAPVDTHRPAVPWAGVARVGDAVTMIPPLCGDGMAMALRSAELCAPLAVGYLAGRLTLREWEQQYTRAWRREFPRRLRVGRLTQAALSVPGVADSVLAAGQVLPAATAWVVRATRG